MKPDLIFSDGSKVGIEVTSAYYHGDPDDPNFHAREEWQFARNPTFDEHGIHQSIDPKTGRAKVWDRMGERLTTSFQLKLNEKCSKHYAGIDRLWLAIYAVGPPQSHTNMILSFKSYDPEGESIRTDLHFAHHH